MSPVPPGTWEQVLILAPDGRDGPLACAMMAEAGFQADACPDLAAVEKRIAAGAGAAIITEEALVGADLRRLSAWIEAQPTWSDFPFVVLTRRGGGLDRNPALARLQTLLGNVAYIERPFHPTTLISTVRAALRGRRRQYEARARLDDLAELNASLETRITMALEEQSAAEAKLHQAQKMEAIGQLTGGVAHDFNNLLQAISACLQIVRRKSTDPALLPLVHAGLQAVDRGGKLTQQLMTFARRQPVRSEVVSIRDQILAMSGLLSRTLRADIALEIGLAPDLSPVEVDPTLLEMAIINLAINARDAMPGPGTLKISAENAATDGAPCVRVTVADTGSGMAPAVLARVFEPFFTTKPMGKGSGLGLAQVHGFARQSGGTCEIASGPGQGTAVTLVLPISTKVSPSAAGPIPAPCATPADRRAHILMVEDDPLVGGLLAAALRDAGYVVDHVTTADEALGRVEAGTTFDLLFTDIVMPGALSGLDLAREVIGRRPETPVLISTGYSEDVAAADTRYDVLPKPYRFDLLVEAIERKLSARAA